MNIVSKGTMTVKRVSGKIVSDVHTRAGIITHRIMPDLSFPDPNRKNVLIMVDSIKRCGAQRVACQAASILAEKCNVILLIFWEKEDTYPLDPRVQLVCIPTIYYGNRIRMGTIYTRALKEKYRIDLSLSLLHLMNCVNVYTKRGECVVVSERNNPKLAFPETFNKCKEIYDRADHVIFQTREVQSMFSKKTQAHSSILPNPVSVTCLAKDVRKPRIVNVARLHKNKNQELLIKAFAVFLQDHPRYTLSLYGDGAEKERLKKLSVKLGIDDKVIFHGNVPDIHEQIADAGMFVLSSNTEGMPNALLEAMMMGLPCISTNCTGAKEVIRNKENGLLTEMENVDSLASAMAYMADHPEEAEKMRKSAMRTAESFRKENVMGQWERLILGLLR